MATIAEILLKAGQDAANARREQGAITGQSIANIGQILGNLPAQYQQAKVSQFQNDQLTREMKAQTAFETALKDQSNYNPDGTTNDDKISQTLKQQSIPAWEHWQSLSAATAKSRLDTLKTLTEIKGSQQSQDEKAQQAQQAKAEYLGSVAYHAEKSIDAKPDDPLHARDTALAAVARAAADGAISEQDAKSFLMQTATANTQQLKQVFSSFVTPKARTEGDKAFADNQEKLAQAAKDLRGPQLTFGQPQPVMIDGKPGFMRAGSDGKPYDLRGNQIPESASITHPPPATTGNADQNQANAKEVARGIIAGTVAPAVLEGTRGTAEGIGLMAEISRQGGDSNKILRDWSATKKAIGSLNSTQQVRLAENINKASESLDKIDELNKQWSDNATRWGIKALNKVSLAAAKNGAYGPEAASVATRLDQQIADVTGELGQVIMGGGSPTDKALGLAAHNLSSDWTQKTLSDAIQQTRYNLNLAQNARNEMLEKLGVTSTQVQTPQSSAPVVEKWERGPDGTLRKVQQ